MFACHLEEHRVGQSYPNFFAAKLASRFVKVVLSGAGGDELFAGYPGATIAQSLMTISSITSTNTTNFWQRLLPNRIEACSPDCRRSRTCMDARYFSQCVPAPC